MGVCKKMCKQPRKQPFSQETHCLILEMKNESPWVALSYTHEARYRVIENYLGKYPVCRICARSVPRYQLYLYKTGLGFFL